MSRLKSPTYVLVHGAWHGGWCWSRVTEILRRSGARVIAPTLTGLAERSFLASPDLGLKTHVNDVLSLCAFEAMHDDIVLCGHSYGGMVIAEAIEALGHRVQAAVFLDAFIPGSGQSLFDLAGPQAAQRFESAAIEVDGCVVVPPIPAAYFRVNENDQSLVDTKCTPHPLKCFTDKTGPLHALAKVPTKIYVRAGAYEQPVFEGLYQKLLHDPGWRCVRMNHGHDLMLDAPQEVSDLLRSAAQDKETSIS